MSRTPIHQVDCACAACRPYRPADAPSASLAASIVALGGVATILAFAWAVDVLRELILPAAWL